MSAQATHEKLELGRMYTFTGAELQRFTLAVSCRWRVRLANLVLALLDGGISSDVVRSVVRDLSHTYKRTAKASAGDLPSELAEVLWADFALLPGGKEAAI